MTVAYEKELPDNDSVCGGRTPWNGEIQQTQKALPPVWMLVCPRCVMIWKVCGVLAGSISSILTYLHSTIGVVCSTLTQYHGPESGSPLWL